MQTRVIVATAIMIVATFQSVQPQYISHGDLQIRVTTQADLVDTLFHYQYAIASDSTSAQPLEALRLEVGDVSSSAGGTLRDFIAPDHWVGWTDRVVPIPVNPSAKAIIVWNIADTIASLDELYSPPTNALYQGASFNISLKSKGLPRIMRFFARGWARPLTTLEYDSLREAGQSHSQIIKPWYQDAFIGKTIVPAIPPTPFVPLNFIDTLIAMKNEAKSLNWIQESDLSDLIDTRLSKARDHLESEDESGALEDLQAALSAVEEDCLGVGPGPGVSYLTTEGCALLRYNIEYLMEQLE